MLPKQESPKWWFLKRGYPVDVSNEVLGGPQVGVEPRLVVTPAQKMAIRTDDHFHQAGRGPRLTHQAAQDRLKVVADLDLPELAGTILADLFGFAEDGAVGHFPPFSFPVTGSFWSTRTFPLQPTYTG